MIKYLIHEHLIGGFARTSATLTGTLDGFDGAPITAINIDTSGAASLGTADRYVWYYGTAKDTQTSSEYGIGEYVNAVETVHIVSKKLRIITVDPDKSDPIALSWLNVNATILNESEEKIVVTTGYKCIDFHDKNLTTTATMLSGTHESIENAYRKPYLLCGLVLEGVEKPAVFAETNVDDGSYTFDIYGGILTVTAEDAVTFATKD